MKNSFMLALALCTFSTTNTMFAMLKQRCTRHQKPVPKTLSAAIKIANAQISQTITQAVNGRAVRDPRKRILLGIILEDMLNNNLDLSADVITKIKAAISKNRSPHTATESEVELKESAQEAELVAQKTPAVTETSLPVTPAAAAPAQETEFELVEEVAAPQEPASSFAEATADKPAVVATPTEQPKETPVEATASATASSAGYSWNPLRWAGLL